MNLIGNSLTIKTKKEMKKNLFMVAAVAIAMVSCNKEDINTPALPQEGEVSDIVFVAESVQTKTAIGEADADGNRAVTWETGDAISINGVEFATQDKGSRAEFTTTVAFDEAEVYEAVYPSTAGKSFSAVTISDKQNGTFADASIAVAQSENQSLSFKNVAAMLKFQVPASAKEVTIESTSNLAGTFAVTFDEEGNPVIGDVSNGSKKITLTADFVTGSDYYVAILPGDHQFTVKIDEFVSKKASKPTTIARQKMMNMKTLPLDLVYLVPNSNWKANNARFAVYNFKDNNTNKWVDLKSYNGMYACEKSSLEYANVIFCRMNPSKAANNWDNKWNQTGDMVMGELSYCIIPFDVWDGCKVWSSENKYNTKGFLHLAPNDDWFTQDNNKDPWFAAYFYGNGTKWVKMDEFSTNPRYYRVTIPTGFPNVIFCRMNANNTTTLTWTNTWNQTPDLTISSNYFYQITDWDAGKWVTK